MQPEFEPNLFPNKWDILFKTEKYNHVVKSYEHISQRAEKDHDIAAQGILGHAMLYGIGTQKNVTSAVTWLRQALVGVLTEKIQQNKLWIVKHSHITRDLRRIARGLRGSNETDRFIAQVTLLEAYIYVNDAKEVSHIKKWEKRIVTRNNQTFINFSEQLEMLNEWNAEFISQLKPETKTLYISLLTRLSAACFSKEIKDKRIEALKLLSPPADEKVNVEPQRIMPAGIPISEPDKVFLDHQAGIEFNQQPDNVPGDDSDNDSIIDADDAPGEPSPSAAQNRQVRLQSEALQPGTGEASVKPLPAASRSVHPSATFIAGANKISSNNKDIGTNAHMEYKPPSLGY